ncbi:DUF808 domain-containing protein [Pigmentiphaga sp. GD03639]|uniref:DUF808 domain-containing protein n=1 Tax=Pigmentiphaga sp. GD03639 TaxID=2975354 RepID=UPI00244BDCB9|nr:DUF808 domain-containing protein [Pigmentiphaga sp. GD03639]MDH2235071.1 DUF808 domain-containing protein [Pigmentiphaga sp. GD03639]
MAGSSFFALLDDIASVLDDISLMTKVAAKKTAGVLGDDLALNAQQVTGVSVNRELPVVWAVAKGSLRNKAILVPAALIISAFAPWAILPLLMVGGAFLCFEGAEKLAAKFLPGHDKAARHDERRKALEDPGVDMVAFERDKIRGAVRTDFILSAEIVAIALGTVAGADFGTQVAVLVGIALLMTIGVYGIVAGVVKLDDAGAYLGARRSAVARAVGRSIVGAAPFLMRGLSVVGTVAMFAVGGSILTHGLEAVHGGIERLAHGAASLPVIGAVAAAVLPVLLNISFGVLAGAAIVLVVELARRLLRRQG